MVRHPKLIWKVYNLGNASQKSYNTCQLGPRYIVHLKCFIWLHLTWQNVKIHLPIGSFMTLLISNWWLNYSKICHFIVNSLWPCNAIWWYRPVSTLARVMACCLAAPSHYLNQCWLFISEVLWHTSKTNSKVSTQATILYNKFKNYIF